MSPETPQPLLTFHDISPLSYIIMPQSFTSYAYLREWPTLIPHIAGDAHAAKFSPASTKSHDTRR